MGAVGGVLVGMTGYLVTSLRSCATLLHRGEGRERGRLPRRRALRNCAVTFQPLPSGEGSEFWRIMRLVPGSTSAIRARFAAEEARRCRLCWLVSLMSYTPERQCCVPAPRPPRTSVHLTARGREDLDAEARWPRCSGCRALQPLGERGVAEQSHVAAMADVVAVRPCPAHCRG